MQSTTAGAITAVGIFFAAYSGSVRQFRYFPLARSRTDAGSWKKTQRLRSIQTVGDFAKAAAPTVLLHGQGLAVATVFSGLAGGAIDGYFADQCHE